MASVQNIMPDMKIIMMDLGMSAEQAEQLQRLRNVEVRKFPFDSFPPCEETGGFCMKIIVNADDVIRV